MSDLQTKLIQILNKYDSGCSKEIAPSSLGVLCIDTSITVETVVITDMYTTDPIVLKKVTITRLDENTFRIENKHFCREFQENRYGISWMAYGI